ncbi:acyltransferase family protein [Actinoplanes xinjiangensis]|uniref:Peptidoglycan/LPS O-acetylase OafA/YrhL n=1 Tax=Actinoplanes xinjiangensis TaxID=512350 RepID=A0A316FTI0_9ACTN|nr:acyltransferase [Actinoplanes xinjiangensis]PWK52024.1 peptidoglycan/LPS O-acetylase OafA/YrhL [Actinoplanes xinjiangensis]
MTAPRLAWLDGLRAVAVLLVVYAHLTRFVFTDLRAVTSEWLHAGTAGVMLFFLVSGYIIPASLERHGDLRAFWRSRARRLFPLYLAVIAVLVVAHPPSDPLASAVGHATMLPFLAGVPLITAVFWTLSFEMAFYLLVTTLFTVRATRSVLPPVVFAIAGAATTPLVPLRLGAVPVVAAVVLAAGLAGVVSGRRWAEVTGGLLLGGLAVTLLLFNMDPAHAHDGLLIVAVMFTGTVVHRADHGRTSWWRAGAVITVVAVALLVVWIGELADLDALTPRYITRSVLTLLVFGGSFAAGMLLRHRRTPPWLARIGVISYSIYLIHYALIELGRPLLTADVPDPLIAAGYLTAVFGLSWLTHRWIEVPGQRLGLSRTRAHPHLEPSRR